MLSQLKFAISASLLPSLVLFFSAPLQAQNPAASKPHLTGKGRQQRIEWFHSQRAYPAKKIPPGARLKALSQAAQMPVVTLSTGSSSTPTSTTSEASGTPSTSASLNSTQWTLIGPQPTKTPYGDPVVSGRVTALAVVPGNPSIVYAGGAQGGVWKTTNGGAVWTPLTDQQPSLAVGSVALDPANPSTVYVGTGEENFAVDSYYGAGILKSTDGGSTWAQLTGPFGGPGPSATGGAKVGSLGVEPGNSQVVLAGVELFSQANSSGVYRSSDAGNTWTKVLSTNTSSGGDAEATALLFNPTNGTIAYAALGAPWGDPQNGIYKSTDGGQTWSQLQGGLPIGAGRISLAIAASNPSTLYASIADASTNSSSLLGVYKSQDSGGTWIKLSVPDFCADQCWYDNVVAVQPNNANVVFLGGTADGGQPGTLLRSLDGGSTWTDVSQGADGLYLHTDMHALAFSSDGATLYAGNDGGMWSASTPTATPVPWSERNDTLAITQFYGTATIDPANANTTFGGTQDNGTQAYSGSLTWNDVACGDGGWTALDPRNTNIVYTNCPGGNLLLKSTSDGAFGSWSDVSTGINTSDPKQWAPPFAIDATNSARLYFGTNLLYQTIDGASTWSPITSDMTGGGGQSISTIAVAPTDPNTVYVGTSDGKVKVTNNATTGAGATWNDRSGGLPNRYVTRVIPDPYTANTAYVTLSGFNSSHIFKTTNSGASWTDISSNLPDIPVNAIVIDPRLAGTYYVGTDIGVFITTNGGSSWSVLATGLPKVAVVGLTLHSASRILRAATHGRGMWDLQLPAGTNSPPFGHVDQAVNASNGTGTMAQNGTLLVSGWAADKEDGSPVPKVEVLIDGVIVGNAMLGGSRPDVAAAFSDIRYTNSGYSFSYNIGTLSPGSHVVSATAFDSNGASAGLGTKTITVTTTNTSPFGWIDTRSLGTLAQNSTVQLSGWAADKEDGSPVAKVQIVLDGSTVIGNATLGQSRPDVAAALNDPRYTNSGWSFSYNIGAAAAGQHTLTAVAFDSQGASAQLQGAATLIIDTPPFGWVDTGSLGTVAQNTTIQISGWAADKEDGSPVAKVQVILDGSTVLGNATLGGSRPDVASALNDPRDANSGWSFSYSIGTLATGSHTVTALAYDSQVVSGQLRSAATFTVSNNTPPFGWVDTRSLGTIAQNTTIQISGWAADQQDGAPVAKVQVILDGSTVLGNATLGGSRPDVATAFNDPRYTNSGWAFNYNVGTLASGSHTITAIAFDSQGASSQLQGAATFSVSGSIASLAHVFFMLQENHSFDNYFGRMGQYRANKGFNDSFDGVPLSASYTDANGNAVSPYHLATVCTEDLALGVKPHFLS